MTEFPHIWVYDLARDVPARLTTDPGDDADPVWLDGQTILFASSRLGPPDVFKTGAGGGRPEELVLKTVGATPTMGISPEGKDLILLTTDVENTGLDLLYASNQSGRYEVYVEPLLLTGERSTVSTDDGTERTLAPRRAGDSVSLSRSPPDGGSGPQGRRLQRGPRG